MRVLITEPTFVQGVPAARGDKIDVTDSVGRDLITAGKAVVAPIVAAIHDRVDAPSAPVEKTAAQKKK